MIFDYVSNDDDWVAIYIGGSLRHEGHDVPDWMYHRWLLEPIVEVRKWYLDFSVTAAEPFFDMISPSRVE